MEARRAVLILATLGDPTIRRKIGAHAVVKHLERYLITADVSLLGRLLGYRPEGLMKGPVCKPRPLMFLSPLIRRIASRLDAIVEIHEAWLCAERRPTNSGDDPNDGRPSSLSFVKEPSSFYRHRTI